MNDEAPMILCLGNEYRGDDAAGLIAGLQLKRVLPDDIEILTIPGEPVSMLSEWEGHDFVILIDAVAPMDCPGKLHRIDVHEQALPTFLEGVSTHAFNVSQAVELARTLGCLPARFVIYGIEGKSFEMGKALSPEVEVTISGLVARIAAEAGIEISLT